MKKKAKKLPARKFVALRSKPFILRRVSTPGDSYYAVMSRDPDGSFRREFTLSADQFERITGLKLKPTGILQPKKLQRFRLVEVKPEQGGGMGWRPER